ncbi:hypothetical protein CFC21_065583 [Triticum aestivum]|uniref:NB-ARC domain-containing protein n=3 Tax=Triticum TaxID=4564 RepID=A0A9R0TQX3_TRITD|nr:putative disease resistance RPP13-like protein 1 [Triticum dicoccoides]XP_044381019.1 putative disease resistance RPP13-like protein 1 [Triticum aestivum]KAF7058553.1 hypothetical protein CFC21_065583 [Triticum aestivum]VAI17368.1 unnamed protein product [Triticum turgidum subsp. durum]
MADVSPSLSRAVATRPPRRRRPTTGTPQPPAETATDRKSKVTGAEARATSRKATTAWLVAYQEAAYAWDDAVDDLEAHVEKEKEQQPSPEGARRSSILRWLLPSSAVHRTEKKLNTNIEKLGKKVLAIVQRGREQVLIQMDWQRHDWISKFSGSPSTNSGSLGNLEQEKMELIDILTDSQSSSTVVAIVGCCGIGKTTLARKVYDDCYTRNVFNTTIWVDGSIESTGPGLLSAVVRAAGGKPGAEEQSREKIMDMLAVMLEGKRFLLVLDDISSHHNHDSFLEDRSFVKHGSRILITTRDQSVAAGMNRSYIHNMQEWPFQDFWTLLCASAGLDKEHDQENLREIVITIIQRCNKVPLAIKIIGGVLATKDPTQAEWQQVNESELWSLDLEDIPGGMKKLSGPVYMAYSNLPYRLKLCFLYCLQLPEGFVISQHVVTQMWIAEGFIIDEENDCDPQDIADRFYRELVLTNLLEPEIGSADMTRCTVHGCVRSVLQLLIKHRWFGKNKWASSIEEAGNMTRFRTVICKNPLADRGLDKVFMGRRYLRVLDLTGTGIRHIPGSIALLHHLRLLNLSLTQIMELPESIESLRNLQFLLLRCCNGLHSLPEGIGKLHDLQCLDLEGSVPQLFLPSLVGLKQLTTLRGFIVNHKEVTEKDVSGWPLEDLEHMNSLRSLQILKIDRVVQFTRAQEAALEMKSHLTQLDLCGSTSDMHLHVPAAEARRLHGVLNSLCPPGCLESLKIASYHGRLFPDWLLQLPSLQRLVLADCKFCESLPCLGQLPQLKFLTITSCSKLRTIQRGWYTKPAFLKLEHLHVDDMDKLESWTGFQTGDFPSLIKFHLDSCPNIESLPACLEYSKQLTSMKVVAAGSLIVIGNLPMLKELIVQDSKTLTSVSNLPSLEVLMVIGCSRLQDVKGLRCVKHLRIVDRELTRLPDWLTGHASVLQTLTVFGTEELLGMLVPSGKDWPAIRDIEKVYGNLTDGSPFFTYTKKMGDFQAFGEQRDLVVRSVVDHQLEGWSSHFIARSFISRISMHNTIKWYLIPLLATALVLLLSMVEEIKVIGVFLVFFAIIACFWCLYFFSICKASN